MGLPRSTYYDTPATEADTEIVACPSYKLRPAQKPRPFRVI